MAQLSYLFLRFLSFFLWYFFFFAPAKRFTVHARFCALMFVFSRYSCLFGGQKIAVGKFSSFTGRSISTPGCRLNQALISCSLWCPRVLVFCIYVLGSSKRRVACFWCWGLWICFLFRNILMMRKDVPPHHSSIVLVLYVIDTPSTRMISYFHECECVPRAKEIICVPVLFLGSRRYPRPAFVKDFRTPLCGSFTFRAWLNT